MVSGTTQPGFSRCPCAAGSASPDYTVTTWYGMCSKGTPADAVALSKSCAKVAATDEFESHLGQQWRWS
jgi:hypothetical protein